MLTILWLFLGAITGFIYTRYAKKNSHAISKIYRVGLIIAAGIYVVFAIFASEPGRAIVIELAGLALFGGAALQAKQSTNWLLVLGWTGHAFWGFALHYLGPATGIAPTWYVLACFTFDLVVAIDIALRIRAFGNKMHGRSATVLSG